MFNILKKLVHEKEEEEISEYGLIVAGIAVVIIVAIAAWGDKLTALFNKLLP